MKFLKLMIIFLSFVSIQKANCFNCYLPEKCQFEIVHENEQINTNNIETPKMEPQIMCDINNDEFGFRYKEPTLQFNNREKCLFTSETLRPSIIFRSTNEQNILSKRFNLTNTLRYMNYFDIQNHGFILMFWDFKGIDVNLIDSMDYNLNLNLEIPVLIFIKTRKD